MSKRNRNWFITSNIGKPEVEDENYSYCLIAEEHAPTTGKLHFHCYIEYKDAKSFKYMTKKFKSMRVEVAKGNAKQQKEYLSKENLIFESGIPKQQGKRNDLIEIKERMDTGIKPDEIAQSHFNSWVKYYKSFEKYAGIIEIKRNWITEVYILYGPSGTGKTKFCIDKGAKIIEYNHPFIGNYDGEDIVLFDEFDVRDMPRTTFLKLTDRYALSVPIKGGYRNWKPKIIYFTTNDTDPSKSWYRGDPAIARRVSFIEFKDTQK